MCRPGGAALQPSLAFPPLTPGAAGAPSLPSAAAAASAAANALASASSSLPADAAVNAGNCAAALGEQVTRRVQPQPLTACSSSHTAARRGSQPSHAVRRKFPSGIGSLCVCQVEELAAAAVAASQTASAAEAGAHGARVCRQLGRYSPCSLSTWLPAHGIISPYPLNRDHVCARRCGGPEAGLPRQARVPCALPLPALSAVHSELRGGLLGYESTLACYRAAAACYRAANSAEADAGVSEGRAEPSQRRGAGRAAGPRAPRSCLTRSASPISQALSNLADVLAQAGKALHASAQASRPRSTRACACLLPTPGGSSTAAPAPAHDPAASTPSRAALLRARSARVYVRHAYVPRTYAYAYVARTRGSRSAARARRPPHPAQALATCPPLLAAAFLALQPSPAAPTGASSSASTAAAATAAALSCAAAGDAAGEWAQWAAAREVEAAGVFAESLAAYEAACAECDAAQGKAAWSAPQRLCHTRHRAQCYTSATRGTALVPKPHEAQGSAGAPARGLLWRARVLERGVADPFHGCGPMPHGAATASPGLRHSANTAPAGSPARAEELPCLPVGRQPPGPQRGSHPGGAHAPQSSAHRGRHPTLPARRMCVYVYGHVRVRVCVCACACACACHDSLASARRSA
jgi:hypothetical protein